MKYFLSAFILSVALAGPAFAHPHEDGLTDAEKNLERIERLTKSKAYLEDRSPPPKKRIMVATETADNIKTVDLGDGLSAVIDGGNVVVLKDGKPLKSKTDDTNMTVEKDVTVKNGRKKTKIVIKLDEPSE